MFSQSRAVSTAEFVLKWPEEARGHLPVVPSSLGLPQGGVSGRDGVTWRWDPQSAEGSNPPAKALQPLPTHPARALPLRSPQLIGIKGERSSAFLLTPGEHPCLLLSPRLWRVPWPSREEAELPPSAGGPGGDHSRLSLGLCVVETVLGPKHWMSVGGGKGWTGTNWVEELRSWESRRVGDVGERKEGCWGAGWDSSTG